MRRHRTIFNVLIEPIKKKFALSDTTMGLLAGFGFVLFYSLLGIPIAPFPTASTAATSSPLRWHSGRLSPRPDLCDRADRRQAEHATQLAAGSFPLFLLLF